LFIITRHLAYAIARAIIVYVFSVLRRSVRTRKSVYSNVFEGPRSVDPVRCREIARRDSKYIWVCVTIAIVIRHARLENNAYIINLDDFDSIEFFMHVELWLRVAPPAPWAPYNIYRANKNTCRQYYLFISGLNS